MMVFMFLLCSYFNRCKHCTPNVNIFVYDCSAWFFLSIQGEQLDKTRDNCPAQNTGGPENVERHTSLRSYSVVSWDKDFRPNWRWSTCQKLNEYGMVFLWQWWKREVDQKQSRQNFCTGMTWIFHSNLIRIFPNADPCYRVQKSLKPSSGHNFSLSKPSSNFWGTGHG